MDTQSDENTSSVASDDDTSKRSVRFIDGANSKSSESASELNEEQLIGGDDESIVVDGGGSSSGAGESEKSQIEAEPESETEVVRKQSTLFHNALRPNSAVRQLFPSAVLLANPAQTPVLTHEALRAFDESKRTHLKTAFIHSDSDTDSIRRTIERNTLRRSLIKYEPK